MAEKSKSFRYRFARTWLNGPRNLFSCCRTPRVVGIQTDAHHAGAVAAICDLLAFGWVNKGTRLRRFREVYTESPVRTANQQSLPVLPCIVLL